MDANLINFVQIWIIIVYCILHKVTFNEAIHFLLQNNNHNESFAAKVNFRPYHCSSDHDFYYCHFSLRRKRICVIIKIYLAQFNVYYVFK